MKRAVISFGDALKACHHLRPGDEDTGRAILELLGLAAEPETPAPSNVGAWKSSSTDHVSSVQRRAALRRGPHAAPERRSPRLPAPRAQSQGVASVVRRVGESTDGFQKPDWLDAGKSLEEAEGDIGQPEPRPLFKRVHRRGILTAAIATHVPEGDLDMSAIIATLAKGLSLPRLPRLASRTTRRGAQVLIDRGQGMVPFREDQRQLVSALDDILADDRMEVLRFAGCPSRGILNPGRRNDRRSTPLRAWTPPPAGTPILTITDLGIGGPSVDEGRATVGEWVRFAVKARRDGYRLVGLVPYEASRWPTRIARAMTLLHWSEHTTVGEVRHALRDAQARLR